MFNKKTFLSDALNLTFTKTQSRFWVTVKTRLQISRLKFLSLK